MERQKARHKGYQLVKAYIAPKETGWVEAKMVGNRIIGYLANEPLDNGGYCHARWGDKVELSLLGSHGKRYLKVTKKL
jgi:hypothetical protein